MFSLLSHFVAVVTIAGLVTISTSALLSPTRPVSARTLSFEGYSDGFFYAYWTDDLGDIDFQNGPGGSYTAKWSGQGTWFGGKGWNPGSARDIHFNGTYDPHGWGDLSVYGWTTSPLVEYWIAENFGTFFPPSSAKHKSTFMSDGSVYDIYQDVLIAQPSIDVDNSNIKRYYSVRRDRRTSGTVTTGNHFNAWAALGMNLGAFDYQIFAVEGYFSNGTANITVRESNSTSTG